MTHHYKFKKHIILIPEPDSDRAMEIATLYKDKAERCGYKNVAFGVHEGEDGRGVWIGSDDYIEGIKCSLALFGKQLTSPDSPFRFKRQKNAHIDRFITEGIKAYLFDKDIEYGYSCDKNFHHFKFRYLSDELTFLALCKGLQLVLPPLNPSRPSSSEAFYIDLPRYRVH